MRLQKLIAQTSKLSRRSAEKAITEGLVTVNGVRVTKLGTVVDPANDRVLLNGKLLRLKSERTYLAFFKPKGFLVTKSDPFGRPTIWHYLHKWEDKLNAVGRLDFDSEGLLLLTDDGDFINKLTHPRHEIWKVYRVRVKGEPTFAAISKLQNGVDLKDGKTLPAKVKRIDKGGVNALIEINIREGRNRQIRRMCDEIGFPVISLRRIAVGPVRLGKLLAGKWRFLRKDEIAQLMKMVGGK